MRNVLCMDIVPFGSRGSSKVSDDDLEYCWKRFTLPLLEKCGARVFFLMGASIEKCFMQSLSDSEKEKAGDCFKNGTYYKYSCGGGPRFVAQLPHPSNQRAKNDALIAQRTPLLKALKSELGL